MSDSLVQIVGRNVRLLRERQGQSKTSFCLMVGMSRPYLNKLEEGTANITLKQLERIADGLGVDPTYLMLPLDESE